MSTGIGPILERVKQPEYTGENRCPPCTAVNVLIAAGIAGLAALVSVPGAAVLFVVSLVAIYVRGYLVPGTPTLTKRYLPDRVLKRFGKTPERTESGSEQTWETIEKMKRHRENQVVPETFLREVGVVTERESDAAQRFTDVFAERYEAALADTHLSDVDTATIARLYDAEPADVSQTDDPYPAYTVGRRVRKWPAEAALLADVALHEALAETTDEWAGVPEEQKRDIRKSLRALLESCVLCGGELHKSEQELDSCCWEAQMIVLACAECDERHLEIDPGELSLSQPSMAGAGATQRPSKH